MKQSFIDARDHNWTRQRIASFSQQRQRVVLYFIDVIRHYVLCYRLWEMDDRWHFGLRGEMVRPWRRQRRSAAMTRTASSAINNESSAPRVKCLPRPYTWMCVCVCVSRRRPPTNNKWWLVEPPLTNLPACHGQVCSWQRCRMWKNPIRCLTI